MILAQASCGHFTLFDANEIPLVRICTCPDLVFVRTTTTAIVARVTRVERHTTSSRRPGADISGAITVTDRAAAICPKCHRAKWSPGGVHAPRVTPRGLVDCRDDLVEVARAQ